ncbi:MAG: methyltransferase domain-containing protein [Microcoleaceae cyanobacterium MO_207.B10]|nr:methyltransferase domain-containing protein [Microcoleaceae cyanobacterium MO_207.B10]
MSKKKSVSSLEKEQSSWFAESKSDDWQTQIMAVKSRFDQEYNGEAFELPPEVEAMPIFQERVSGNLNTKVVSPFWEIAKPKKNQKCLDIGCGVSFLVYPWRDWEAFFYGQEISTIVRDNINHRGSLLNYKLFKGVELGPAHQLNYEANEFELAIATGFSCYYPLDYWMAVIQEVKRVLKAEGQFVFDVINPEQPLAENWAILETYLGSEVFLFPLEDWEKMIKAMGGKIVKRLGGELFQLYKVKF